MSTQASTEDVLAFAFADGPCLDCAADKNEDCPILAGAFSEWPVQWVDGKCTAYRREGEREPVQRCEHTKELPL